MKSLMLLLSLLSLAIPARAETLQVVGSEFPPLMHEENGKPAGLSVELLQMMLQDMKEIDVEIRFYPVPRMLKMVEENRDTLTLSVTRNPEREPLFQWVGPICSRTNALFKLKSRSELQPTTLADVQPYKIGVGRGYAALKDLLNAGIPKENIEEVTEDVQNIKKLFAQRVDFVASNDLVFLDVLKREGHQWNDVEKTLILDDKYQYYYAFNKDMGGNIVQRFQRTLDDIKRKGQYDELLKKYFVK